MPRYGVIVLTAILVGGCAHTPRDMVAFFNSDVCPNGWSDVSADWQGRYVVIGRDDRGQTVGEALAAAENRATGGHGHTVTPGSRSVLVPRANCNVDNSCRRTGYYDSGDAFFENENAQLSVGAATPRPGETVRPGTNAPYVTLRACAKS